MPPATRSMEHGQEANGGSGPAGLPTRRDARVLSSASPALGVYCDQASGGTVPTVLLLDQSNAHGQLDLIGMTHLVSDEPTFCKTWDEAQCM